MPHQPKEGRTPPLSAAERQAKRKRRLLADMQTLTDRSQRLAEALLTIASQAQTIREAREIARAALEVK